MKNIIILNCKTCKARLSGRQRQYCCKKCRNSNINHKHQDYQCQQARGAKRKIELMKLFDSKCKLCGYNKNSACLAFHHREPELKSFQIDLRKCSNSKWKNLLKEAGKCDLLCMNCHGESHHPESSML